MKKKKRSQTDKKASRKRKMSEHETSFLNLYLAKVAENQSNEKEANENCCKMHINRKQRNMYYQKNENPCEAGP